MKAFGRNSDFQPASTSMEATHTTLDNTTRLSQLLLLTTATFGATYGRFALGPLQETMRLSLALDDNQIALLQGLAMAVPMALGSIPIGLLVDRHARARLFVVSAGLSLAATALTAFATSFAMLFFVRCLAGFASAATLVTAFSVLADLYPPAQRGRATMVTLFGEIGGAPAAFAMGGALLMSAASASGLDAWRSALLWMCVPLLPIMFLLLLVREPRRMDIQGTSQPSVRAALPRLWEYRAVVAPLLLARVMVWIADGAVLVWGAPTFSRKFGLPPDQIGAIMATALLISGVAGPVLGGPLADLCQRSGGPRRTMTAMCIAASLSVPAALFALMPGPTSAGIALGLFLTFGFMIGTAALALATIVIPGELRGLNVALTVAFGSIFSIGVAPLAVSGLSGAIGGPAAIGAALAVVCAITSLFAAGVFLGGRTYFPGAGRQGGQCKATVSSI